MEDIDDSGLSWVLLLFVWFVLQEFFRIVVGV